MKAAPKWVFSALVSALGALGVHGSAMAETTQPGGMCKPTGNSNRAGLVAYSWGVRNETSFNMGVICPVVRSRPPLSSAFQVLVNLTLSAGQCTLISYGPDGRWRGQSPWREGGSMLLGLVVTSGSYQTVYCILKPNGGVTGIRPQQ